jgi:methyl-accepting chemotaxis protein
VIEAQYELFKSGQITEDEARERARNSLRKIRYNKGVDYFFIYDMGGINIMHGAKPEREGRNFLDSTDAAGKPYIREWIEKLKQNGSASISLVCLS